MDSQKRKCLVCGNKWTSRTQALPKACPGCKSYKWNSPNDGTNRAANDVAKVDMICTKCGKELPEGATIYRLQEGVNKGGVFTFRIKANQGLSCEECAPPEDVLPFIGDSEMNDDAGVEAG